MTLRSCGFESRRGHIGRFHSVVLWRKRSRRIGKPGFSSVQSGWYRIVCRENMLPEFNALVPELEYGPCSNHGVCGFDPHLRHALLKHQIRVVTGSGVISSRERDCYTGGPVGLWCNWQHAGLTPGGLCSNRSDSFPLCPHRRIRYIRQVEGLGPAWVVSVRVRLWVR